MKSILLALGILTSLQGFSDELISTDEQPTVPIDEKTQTVPIQKENPPWLNQLWIIPGFVSFYLLGKDSKVTNPGEGTDEDEEEETYSGRVFDEKDEDLKILFSIQDAEQLRSQIIEAPIGTFIFMEQLLQKKLNQSTFILQMMDYLESSNIQTHKEMEQVLYSEGYEYVEQKPKSKMAENSEGIILRALYRILVNTQNIFKSYFDDEYSKFIARRVDPDLLKDRSVVSEQEQKKFLEKLLKLKMSTNRNQEPIKHNAIDLELSDEDWSKVIQQTGEKMSEEKKVQFLTRTTGLFVFITQTLYPEAPVLRDFTEGFLEGNTSYWLERVSQEFRRIQKHHTP